MSRSTTRAGVSISRTSILPLPGQLDFKLDSHFVAHQDAAGFQRHVPDQPEILAIHFVVAVAPILMLPQGSFTSGVGPSTASATSLVTPWMVRSR